VTSADHDRATRREREIAQGALALFLERGFHGTSIREIAASAGLSMGGLYEYISSKDDVLSMVYRSMTSPLEDVWDGATDVETLIFSVLTASWERSRDVQILYRETVHLDAAHREELAATERAYARVIAEAITAGVERGELVCDDPLLVGHLVMFLAAFMPLRSWITRPDGIDASEETARSVAALVANTLRSSA